MDSDDDIPLVALAQKTGSLGSRFSLDKKKKKKGVKKEGSRNGAADGYDSDDVPLISFVKKESKVKKAKKNDPDAELARRLALGLRGAPSSIAQSNSRKEENKESVFEKKGG